MSSKWRSLGSIKISSLTLIKKLSLRKSERYFCKRRALDGENLKARFQRKMSKLRRIRRTNKTKRR